MSKVRLTSRRLDNGQYRLESMAVDEHAAYEAELARVDFAYAHGDTTPAIFDDLWKRQQGLCALCMSLLDFTTAFYEEGEASALHCTGCSSVLTVRAIDNPASYVNDGHLRTDKLMVRK